MKSGKIIRKAQEEEGREKHQTTDKFLKVQAEEEKKRRKKIINPAVKTGRREEIWKKMTSIIEARPRKEVNLEAIVKAGRNQEVKKETPNTADMMRREDQEAKRGTVRKIEKKKSTMILEGEIKKEVGVKREAEGQVQEVMNVTIGRVKTGRNISQEAESVSMLEENIVPAVEQGNEAKAEIGVEEVDQEAETEIAVEVKNIQETGIENQEEDDQEAEKGEVHQIDTEEEKIGGGETQGARRERKVKAETEKDTQIGKVEAHIRGMIVKAKGRGIQKAMKVAVLNPVKVRSLVEIKIEVQIQKRDQVAKRENQSHTHTGVMKKKRPDPQLKKKLTKNLRVRKEIMPLVRIKSLIVKQVLEQMMTGMDECLDLMFPLSQSFRDVLRNAFF